MHHYMMVAIIDVTVAQAIIMPYIICNFINALHIKRKMDFRLIGGNTVLIHTMKLHIPEQDCFN